MTCIHSKDSDEPGHLPSLEYSSLHNLCVAKDPVLLHADNED